MSADPATVPVEIHAPGDLPDTTRDEIRERLAGLARYTDEPIQSVRLTLRRPETRAARSRWVADASLVLNGRPLAAHATGSGERQAVKEVADRLRRQMRRVADAGVALRNEVEHRPRPRLKPPELRDIIPRRTAYPFPETTFDAVMDLLDLDHAEMREAIAESRDGGGRSRLPARRRPHRPAAPARQHARG